MQIIVPFSDAVAIKLPSRDNAIHCISFSWALSSFSDFVSKLITTRQPCCLEGTIKISFAKSQIPKKIIIKYLRNIIHSYLAYSLYNHSYLFLLAQLQFLFYIQKSFHRVWRLDCKRINSSYRFFCKKWCLIGDRNVKLAMNLFCLSSHIFITCNSL